MAFPSPRGVDATELDAADQHRAYEAQLDSPDEVRRLRERLVGDGVELVEDEDGRPTSDSSA